MAELFGELRYPSTQEQAAERIEAQGIGELLMKGLEQEARGRGVKALRERAALAGHGRISELRGDALTGTLFRVYERERHRGDAYKNRANPRK